MADISVIIDVLGAEDMEKAARVTQTLQNKVQSLGKQLQKGNITNSQYQKGVQQLIKKNADFAGGYKALQSQVQKYAFSLQRQINETKKAEAAQELLTKETNQASAAIKQQNAAMAGLSTRSNRLAKDVQMSARAMNQYGVVASDNTRRFKRFGAVGLQQVGYQVQDFAVQVQSGTSAFVALGQQGSQLLGIFGPKGAILGAFLAIGTAILNVKDQTGSLSFAFKDFWNDAKGALEPLKPLWDAVASAVKFAGGIVVDAINLIINAIRAFGVVVGALPEAVRVGVDNVVRQFSRLQVLAQKTAMSVRATWQSLMDTITGSTTMVTDVGFDEQGNPFERQVEAAEFYRDRVADLQTQIDALVKSIKENSPADVIKDAFKDFEYLDLRDYFGRDGKATEGEGGAANEIIKELTKAQEAVQSLADTIKSSMSEAFMSMVEGTKSAKDAFRDMARAIIKQLFDILVVQQIVGSFDVATGTGSGIVGAIMGAFANGAAFNNGKVTAFADGGVVSSPTMFPMANGAGLMGEAGPEAIMPLKRGKNGKLGVQVEGSQGNVTVENHFHIAANGDESVKRIIAQEAPKIANLTQKQILDQRRRGGVMKSTFGG